MQTENFSMGSFSEDEPEGIDYADALKALAGMSVLTDLWSNYNQVTPHFCNCHFCNCRYSQQLKDFVISVIECSVVLAAGTVCVRLAASAAHC
jgi:hypothetical protein